MVWCDFRMEVFCAVCFACGTLLLLLFVWLVIAQVDVIATCCRVWWFALRFWLVVAVDWHVF